MRIIISRDPGFGDNMLAYQIILDGKNIGEINVGQIFRFDV